MRNTENCIWLPADKYPDRQLSDESLLGPVAKRKNYKYTVAEFSRSYSFGKKIAALELRVSGDTAFRLYIGEGKYTVYGPATISGDFLSGRIGNECLHAYSTCVEPEPADENGLSAAFAAGVLNFRAQVRLTPEREYEYSAGQGSFALSGKVIFDDGSFSYINTDTQWDARLLPAYASAGQFDDSAEDEEPVKAALVQNIWQSENAPIPPCTVEAVYPENGGRCELAPGAVFDGIFEFDRIYAGYVAAKAGLSGKGRLSVRIECIEEDENGSVENCVFTRKTGSFQSFGLHSAAKYRVHAENLTDGEATLRLWLMASCYPVAERAETRTSDEDLNAVLRACENNLRWCRQTLHLDSARHCEPLACTGDYYIESLMTSFSFGDLRLAAFDVRRTAENLAHRDGRIFHTSYSLIWVQMLWDVYMLSADSELLPDCTEALTKLLDRFDGYLGENGLIETPPDYMFIDWLNPDGISMHHPPKALGQTCLCMFYYGALATAAKIYAVQGYAAMEKRCLERASALKKAVMAQLWDSERGLFFEGLNTPTPENMLYRYMPQNVEKRYYRRHANILAVYSGMIEGDEAKALLRRIYSDDSLGEVQPYFMHFWLEAIYRTGLRDEESIELLRQWIPSVKEYPKGISEGFYKPEPTYRFDHSHAWGGTPLYSLPLALSGLELLEPGYRKIRLTPSLLGLDSARTEIPTPYGKIVIEQKKGQEAQITLPDGIELVK